jgi:hypothetical protein
LHINRYFGNVPNAARQRALRTRQIYESLRLEIDAFRQLPGVEMVPSRAFKTWLRKQVQTSVDLPAFVSGPSLAPEAAAPGPGGFSGRSA